MAGKKNAKSSDKDAFLKRLTELFELEERTQAGELPDDARRHANASFWTAMRAILSVNEFSTGLQYLDDVAVALLSDDMEAAADAFGGVVSLLPAPSKQRAGANAPSHPVFQEPAKRALEVESKPPAKRTKKAKAAAKTSTAKSASTTPSSVTMSTPPSSTPTTFIDFAYSRRAPPSVIFELERMYEAAHNRGKSVERFQYAWEGRYLWYDPEEFPLVHLVHWRFWMAFRHTFWEWGLHAPLADSGALTDRRKHKMAAIAARLIFTSLCIECWGYFRFLHRIEYSGHRDLFWWGGQPGRTRSDKRYKGPIVEDLGVLFRSSKTVFQQKIRRAQKPYQLDQDGFKNVPELLVFTEALDPDQARSENRLSDRALAKVYLDATSKVPRPVHWVGDLDEGVWAQLCTNARIIDLAARIPTETPDEAQRQLVEHDFTTKEVDKSTYSPLKHSDGTYTALPPKSPVPEWDPTSVLSLYPDLADDREEKDDAPDDAGSDVTTPSNVSPSGSPRTI